MAIRGLETLVIGPVPAGPLLLETFQGKETLGIPYRYDLTVLSDDPNIPVTEVLGQPLAIRFALYTGGYRYFHGIVTYFAKTGPTSQHTRYALVLNPNLALFDYARDCRVINEEGQTALSIVTDCLAQRGYTDVESGSIKDHVYLKREYCLQYRETDLNFIQRLLEEEGIYYFFKHEDAKQTLVLADSVTAHATVPGYESVVYAPKEHKMVIAEEHFWSLRVAGSLFPGDYTVVRGYDYTQVRPLQVQFGKRNSEQQLPGDDFEDYDYPGGLSQEPEAKQEALVRMQTDLVANTVIEVEGNTMGLGIGHLVKLKRPPALSADFNPLWTDADFHKEYLITSATYSISINQHETGDTAASDEPFKATYTLLDSQTQFRPRRTAIKPRIEGPQTALVVGPSTDEIYTDKYGRVKIQFDWDRLGNRDEDSSCWVRVSQVWAGNKWGAIHIPRIGQEVIVEFLDGDPDRPIITGRVYNTDNMPPYTLPDNRTQSGIKSRSSKGGSASNFNEIRFEDLKGKEELHIQAERDMSTLVKADQSNTIGGNRTSTITGKDTTTVEKDRVVNVTGSLFTFVDGSPNNGDFQSTHSVTGKYNLFASEEIIVQADKKIEFTCGSSKITMVPGTITLEINEGGKIVLDANLLAQATGGKANMKLTDKVNLEANDGSTLALDANAKLHGKASTNVDAGTEAIFGAGGSVKANKSGVEITGTIVKLNS